MFVMPVRKNHARFRTVSNRLRGENVILLRYNSFSITLSGGTLRLPRFLCLVGTLTWFSAGSSAVGQTNVDAYIRETMRESGIPGLSIAVLKGGKVVKASGYGIANLETNTPATPHTVYKTASLSKQFIAAAVMLLVQEGKVRLDDMASAYLDGSPESWKDITVRHLLTGTSGIVRDPLERDYEPYREQPVTDVIKAAYPIPLRFSPGEKWSYSNVGYYVLAEIISRASGKAWNEFIAERLFVPAGMKSTRLTTTTEIVPQRAAGYRNTSKGWVNAEDWIAPRPSGAFLSTVLDMAKWDAFLDTTRILTDSSKRLMWTRATLTNGGPTNYGFGWIVDSFLGRRRIHHDGQFPGFRSDYERFPDDKLTVIVLANSDNARVEWLALKIAGFYAPTLTAPRFVLRADAPAGRITSGNPVPVRLTAKAEDKAAPETVFEIEIWDSSDKSVFKESKSNENFVAGEAKTYEFLWTPAKPGKYQVNISAFGPRFSPPYAFKPRATTITVH
jgi:CubicO group peptidase (beta-lactamase class C family)